MFQPGKPPNRVKHHEPSSSPRDHAPIAQDGGEGGIGGSDLLHILQQMLHLSYPLVIKHGLENALQCGAP